MHALLHSGRRGARGFGLRAASLRGLPLAMPAEPGGASERALPAISLAAGLERLERNANGERESAQHPPVPASVSSREGARANAPAASSGEPG